MNVLGDLTPRGVGIRDAKDVRGSGGTSPGMIGEVSAPRKARFAGQQHDRSGGSRVEDERGKTGLFYTRRFIKESDNKESGGKMKRDEAG